MSDPQTAPAPKTPRLPLVDLCRGAALIGVMAYHLTWDLRYYEFVLWPIDSDWGWIAVQKVLVGSFVGLSGLSLYLAHGKGIVWRAFWRRWVLLFAAAMLVTAAIWIAYPQAFVYFGVLHALALFALLGLIFLRVPPVALFGLGAAIVALGALFQHPAFDAKILSWLGFWQVPPLTNDLVPIFPWFGLFLIGIGLGRLAVVPAPRPPLLRPVTSRFGRSLIWIGRHSLLIYLVHQPLLLGVLVPLDALVQPHSWHRAEFFRSDCQQSCGLGGAEVLYCRRYCACSLEQMDKDNLWEAVTAFDPTPEQSRAVDAMVGLCTAMGRGGAP